MYILCTVHMYLDSDTVLHLTLYVVDVVGSLCHGGVGLLQTDVGMVFDIEVFHRLL